MTYTVTLTETHAYVAIIVFLLLLQIRQQFQISKAEKETKKIWEQLAILWYLLGARPQQQTKQPDNNETKN